MKKILIFLAHLFFRPGIISKEIKKFSAGVHNKTILEIGSGKNSSKRFFNNTNVFVMSDKRLQLPGCKKIDVCNMKFKNTYDLIICINVLDDIFNYQQAVNNIFNALKKRGQIFLVVNGFYPLHDLPNDYWRFTEFSLRKIFSKFNNVHIKYLGIKYLPSYYVLTAQK